MSARRLHSGFEPGCGCVPQREGLRKGHRCPVFQPALRVIKSHPAIIILYQMPDEIMVQIDVKGHPVREITEGAQGDKAEWLALT